MRAAACACDQRKVRRCPRGGFEHLQISMLAVDAAHRGVDFRVKFDAKRGIFPHQHLAQTNVFVIQGEHRIYVPDRTLEEIRRTGSHAARAPGGVHVEGGGNEDCVVPYHIRGNGEDESFQVTADDGQVVGLIGVADLAAPWEARQAG